MDRNTLSNFRVRMHYDKSRELTNNLLFMHAVTVEDSDKNFVFNPDVANSLKWPSNIKTMHDYRMMYSGVYDRLYQICVISLCSDIEFFFKDIFDEYGYTKGSGNGFFQRFDDVIASLSDKIDFSGITTSLETLRLAFQIRHICIHNMGFVDENFNSKTNLGTVGSSFNVSQSEFRCFFDAYEILLKHLDKNLPAPQV